MIFGFNWYTIKVYIVYYLHYYYCERFRFGFCGTGVCSVTYSCMIAMVGFRIFFNGLRGVKGRVVSLWLHALADLDTNALLPNDPAPSDMNALRAALLTGGREYISSQASVSVTAGRKHGVDVKLDQNDLAWFWMEESTGCGTSTGRLFARSSSSFFCWATFFLSS